MLSQFSQQLAVTRQLSRGGGTLISLESDYLRAVRRIAVNQDMQLVKVIAHSERYIWFKPIYLPRGSRKEVQALFQKIQELLLHPIEINNLLMIGDWNIGMSGDSDEVKFLKDIAKKFRL